MLKNAKKGQNRLESLGLSLAEWSERWFPDAFVFAILAVMFVSFGALILGSSPESIAVEFGKGFWDLIPFTMQMALVVVGGFVVATSAPVASLIQKISKIPQTGRSAVGFVALLSMLTSLISWGFSLIFSGLLVKELARRKSLGMDYRAAGAAAYLGLGSIWALGLSSSAAQIQANKLSLPKELYQITGVIPFTETIFLWQGLATIIILIIVSVGIAYYSAPSKTLARSAESLGVNLDPATPTTQTPERPGEWLEYSPLLTLFIVCLGAAWICKSFSEQGPMIAISSLNTYNFIFFILGFLLHWRPKNFLKAITQAIPATTGVIVQFPFYASTAAILTNAKNSAGMTLSTWIAEAFVAISNTDTFPLLVAAYSAVLGLFIPSAGGKWIIEAPYIMQAANSLHIHLGWVVQIYNAAEALPNLASPFWMLPLLGILGLKARDLVGFSMLQFVIHVPLVFVLLWFFSKTLAYHPPTF